MPWPPIIFTCRKAPWTWNLVHTTKVLVWNLNMKVTKISCSGLYLWRTVHAPCQLQYNTSFRGPVSEGLHYANPSKRFKKEIQIPPPKKNTQKKMVTRYTGTLATTTNTCEAEKRYLLNASCLQFFLNSTWCSEKRNGSKQLRGCQRWVKICNKYYTP